MHGVSYYRLNNKKRITLDIAVNMLLRANQSIEKGLSKVLFMQCPQFLLIKHKNYHAC